MFHGRERQQWIDVQIKTSYQRAIPPTQKAAVLECRHEAIHSGLYKGMRFSVALTCCGGLSCCSIRPWQFPALPFTRETSFSSTATKREDTSTRILRGSRQLFSVKGTVRIGLFARLHTIYSSKFSAVTVFTPEANAPPQDPGLPNVHC